ncbi:hypothetical protein GJ496_010651 [Pomphorhynchus laevis]|nr:hypothetical protein GJ496_010651 [Pomphorhynchus laevis]
MNCTNNRYLILFLLATTSLQIIVHGCPLQTDSPCHCGIRNDSTSYIQCNQKSLLEIPEFMHSFSYDQLILSGNFISSINDQSFENVRVRQVFFTDNPLSNISTNAFGQQSLLNHLEELYIDFLKSVKSIPYSLLCRAGKLKVLDIKGMNLGANVNLIACKNMTRMHNLVLSDCGIKENFKLTNFDSLKELDLSRNEIGERWPSHNTESLPVNLKSLNLSDNKLTEMTAEMSATLTTVDLSNNQLSDWPQRSFCKSKNLRNIYLNSNRLSKLPTSILKDCVRLKLNKLFMRSNSLTSFAYSFESSTQDPQSSVAKFNIFEHVTILDLSWNKLDHFDTLSLANGVEELYLTGNKLENVPLNIPISLRILDLSYNKICSISSSSVKLLSRLKAYSLDDNPFFCDCNLRALQLDLKRRERNIHGNNIKCMLPKQLKGTLLNDAVLKCCVNVPNCVKQVHGPHLQQPSKADIIMDNDGQNPVAGITDVYVRYLHNAHRTILVIWDWISNIGEDNREDYAFRISFEPHLKSKTQASDINDEEGDNGVKNEPNTIQMSSQLPSTARRFTLQNAMPDHVYTVCVISMQRSDSPLLSSEHLISGHYNRKRCTDIYTGNSSDDSYQLDEDSESSRNVIYSDNRKDKHDILDTSILTVLVVIIVVVTTALTFVLVLLIALIIRRRYELRKWQKINCRNHLLSSLESGSSYPFINNSSGERCPNLHHYQQQLNSNENETLDSSRLQGLNYRYCRSCCCCCTSDGNGSNNAAIKNSQSTINPNERSGGTMHLYHEINDNLNTKFPVNL